MLLVEFIVLGKPVPANEPDRLLLDAWKRQVRDVARNSLQLRALPTVELSLRLTHYFDLPLGEEDLLPDAQAIAKPIVEALQGILFSKTEQIVEIICLQRNLNSSFRIRSLSSPLAMGLHLGGEFVHAIFALHIRDPYLQQYPVQFENDNFSSGGALWLGLDKV